MVFFASVQEAAEAEKGFDISPPGGYNKQVFTCGVSTSVVRRLPKPNRRVRLPYPAPVRRKRHIACDDFFVKIIARSFCSSSLPHETLLCKLPRGPRPLRGMLSQVPYPLRRFFCQNHRALILQLLTSPRNFALQTSAGPPAASRHVIASVISLAAIFLSKSSRAHFAAPHFPTKLCFANFRGGPGRFAACYCKRHIACGGFL